jgi:hypothetical protein
MKIHLLGAELYHAGDRTDGQTDRHDEASSRFSQLCERTETGCVITSTITGQKTDTEETSKTT